MKAIAFFTNKGGVGKTTLTCNLAAYLSAYHDKKILIVDADPQANSSQYIFDDSFLDDSYSNSQYKTIFDVAKPLSQGKGYSDSVNFIKSDSFGVDVLLGDPRLALIEDVLASDWSLAGVRGLRTTYMFRQLLSHCDKYDYVFFDLGPSLGSINRAVLIACDYFVLPLSMDIFSARATENISVWIKDWSNKLDRSISSIDDIKDLEISDIDFRLSFLGYTNQQYTAKRDAKGEKRAVKAYEKIMKTISSKVRENLISTSLGDINEYKLGDIPNLHSLVPMSQVSHKPIFKLAASDGIVGAHFSKVNDALEIFSSISGRFLSNLETTND
ncbi:ParA family protein [Aeromonas veronii]|uniref:ParA family protein n=1 Tax=Aeromonas veronii TaxID=654 RepID=UPI00191D20E2|nr:AAA family ATPase [Aeromonas veronii]MBL0491857.1 AAA family ATPase [Aeromonas veronii]